MEQSSQMSAEQSLKLINETLRDSRLVITKRSGSHFILWGAILTLIALAVYFLWRSSGNPAWNLLWFAMPAIGYPLAVVLDKDAECVPSNLISNLLGWTWGAFGAFAVTVSLCALLFAPMNLTLVIILLFRLCGEHLGDDPQKPADCHRWISHRCPWCHSGSETLR